MATIIPLTPTASSQFTITIEGINLSLKVNWNSKEEAYRLDIFTDTLNPILLGLKLLPTVNLTGQYLDSRLPTGEFFCVDIESKGVRPSFEDLGARVQLWYLTEEEIDDFAIS